MRDHPCDSRIIKWFDDEQDAYAYEKARIEELKAVGLCSCNIIPGGTGRNALFWTEEMRNKIFDKNNPEYDEHLAMEIASMTSRHVIIDGKEYPSIRAVCDVYHVMHETVKQWCHKGVTNRMEKCWFADEQPVEFTGKRFCKCNSKAVVFRGNTYEAIIDMAHDIGIDVGTATTWLQRGFNTDGEPVRFVNDDRELEFIDYRAEYHKRRSKHIIVNGVWYDSIKDATEALGICRSVLYRYLHKKRFNPAYICEYAD